MRTSGFEMREAGAGSHEHRGGASPCVMGSAQETPEARRIYTGIRCGYKVLLSAAVVRSYRLLFVRLVRSARLDSAAAWDDKGDACHETA